MGQQKGKKNSKKQTAKVVAGVAVAGTLLALSQPRLVSKGLQAVGVGQRKAEAIQGLGKAISRGLTGQQTIGTSLMQVGQSASTLKSIKKYGDVKQFPKYVNLK